MKVYSDPNIRVFRYDDGEESAFQMYASTQRELLEVTDHRYLHVLGYASDGVHRNELVKWVMKKFSLTEQAAIYLCKNLSDKGLLITKDQVCSTEQETSCWQRFGWQPALEYYRTTLDRNYDDHEKASRDWDERLKENEQRGKEQPNVYKQYPVAETVDLDEPTDEELGSFADVIERGRLAPEETSEMAVSKDKLSTMLYYTFGEMEVHSLPTGKYILKTSPSAGARHPTEAYVAAVNVDGLETAVYHYSVRDHSLEVVQNEVMPLLDATCGPDEELDLLVVCSSVVYRSMMKYPSHETFQMINHDIGHLMETLRLVSNSLGLQFGLSDRLRVDEVAEVLSLTPASEPIFGYATLWSGR